METRDKELERESAISRCGRIGRAVLKHEFPFLEPPVVAVVRVTVGASVPDIDYNGLPEYYDEHPETDMDESLIKPKV